jgi:uncharacterized protein YndB with AHSA1/START domain
MPKVSRSRTVTAAPSDVWRVVGDPSHLPRWWPMVERVENVRRAEFTQVLRSKKGKAVRADYRVVEEVAPQRRRWAQEVAGTPFEKFLALNEAEVVLEGEYHGPTKVTLTARQKLRGLSRLGGGSIMLRRATRRQLEEALERLEGLL